MASNLPLANVIVSYSPQYSAGVPIVPLGLVLLGVILFRLIRQSPEERIYTVVWLAILVIGIAIAVTITSFSKLNTVEVTSAGTVDFVYRTKRESFPLARLTQVEGYTTRSTGHWNPLSQGIKFTLHEIGQEPVEKRAHILLEDMEVARDFVRGLEDLSPRTDTAKFWQWSRATMDS